MLTASSTLAIFAMLGLSSLAVFWAKRIKLPHTVFLVLLGIGLGLLTHIFPTLTFFEEFRLTPELLFFLLLPTLIFESAYNINIRRMVEDTIPVLVLAVISLVMSAGIVGAALYVILPHFGIMLPLSITLLFGALISATDPVAVLALFKEFGAPRRLSLIFEGESLFNDATGVALFLVILSVVIGGYHGTDTILNGVTAFTSMLVGGVIFGLITGGLFAKLVGITRESETASITLTIVLAHTTFILSYILSDILHLGSLALPLSPIIATTVASLVMGNYGRPKIHPRAEAFVEQLWGQLAFMANSLIFILIGLLATTVPFFSGNMLLVIIVTILVVAIARAVSIYPIVAGFNAFTSVERVIPSSWQHLLSWGSLRGALAVTMVLLIPDSLTVPGWHDPLSIKEFILSLTVGCIIATLFVKATTISVFMHRLKLDQMTDTEELEYHEAKALIHREVSERLARYEQRGYISPAAAAILRHQHDQDFAYARTTISTLSKDAQTKLAHRVLRMFAIGIEKRHLKELYHHDEVNELVYRRLTGKLQLQLEAVERGELEPNLSLHTDNKDVFEHLASFIRSLVSPIDSTTKIMNDFMYYRAQAIIARKVLKELADIDTTSAESIFTKDALSHTTDLYETFKDRSRDKMRTIETEHTETITALATSLAQRGVHKIEENLLGELYERELITPKLFVTLSDELQA